MAVMEIETKSVTESVTCRGSWKVPRLHQLSNREIGSVLEAMGMK